MRDGYVAEERTCVGRNDGEVGVVALEGGEQGNGDAVGGVEGESGGRIEVFNGGLRGRRG